MRRLSLLIVLLFLAMPGLDSIQATVAGEQDFLLFYSNDVVGETEPCG